VGTKITFVSLIFFSLTALISTQTPIIVSNYTGELTLNSDTYTRHQGPAGSYYYQAIPVRVDTTGTYTFKTSSTIGDTFGYLYQGNFYPEYPSYNIVTSDDDTAGNRQFQLTATLRSDITYILVFTTYQQRLTGEFSISASGPDYVFYPTEIIQTTTGQQLLSCSVNEVLYENHCYYLDGIGGQCPPGYTLGSEAVLSIIANSFVGLNYKTTVSNNCCVITSEISSNYGMSGQCNAQGPFRVGPTLNGGGCRNFTGRQSGQLTFCVSN